MSYPYPLFWIFYPFVSLYSSLFTNSLSLFTNSSAVSTHSSQLTSGPSNPQNSHHLVFTPVGSFLLRQISADLYDQIGMIEYHRVYQKWWCETFEARSSKAFHLLPHAIGFLVLRKTSHHVMRTLEQFLGEAHIERNQLPIHISEPPQDGSSPSYVFR